MKTTDNGKMVNISLDEAKELYRKGFQEIALRAYPIELLEKFGIIQLFVDVCSVLAKNQYFNEEKMHNYAASLYNTKNPLEVMMLINKAMHLYSENCHHYFFLNKWGNVVRVKNPSTIQEKTFCFASVEMAKHVWKYFKDEVIAAADYVVKF